MLWESVATWQKKKKRSQGQNQRGERGEANFSSYLLVWTMTVGYMQHFGAKLTFNMLYHRCMDHNDFKLFSLGGKYKDRVLLMRSPIQNRSILKTSKCIECIVIDLSQTWKKKKTW